MKINTTDNSVQHLKKKAYRSYRYGSHKRNQSLPKEEYRNKSKDAVYGNMEDKIEKISLRTRCIF
ncbi:MAG: hypothetical protein WCI23_01885 [Chlorobiaceae bacterium]